MQLECTGDRLPAVCAAIEQTTRLPAHDHVAFVLGALVFSAEMHLVVEFCPGPFPIPLNDPVVDLHTSIEFCADACRGLMCVHAAGVVHGAVKPSNFLLSNQGYIKVADFGLVHLRGSGVDAHTRFYAAPEVIRHWDGDDATAPGTSWAADVFSFGYIMFELVTGRSIFAEDARDQSRILRDVVQRHLRPAWTAADRARIPDAIRTLIGDMWHVDAKQRPATADVMSRLVRACLLCIGLYSPRVYVFCM